MCNIQRGLQAPKKVALDLGTVGDVGDCAAQLDCSQKLVKPRFCHVVAGQEPASLSFLSAQDEKLTRAPA